MKITRFSTIRNKELEVEISIDRGKFDVFIAEKLSQSEPVYKCLKPTSSSNGDMLICNDQDINFFCINVAAEQGDMLPELYEKLKL